MRSALGYKCVSSQELNDMYNKGGCWKAYLPYDSSAATLEACEVKFQQLFYDVCKPVVVDYDVEISHAVAYEFRRPESVL